MKILLANAPWYTADRFGVRAGSRWPFSLARGPHDKVPGYVPFPFFLAYAASALQQARHEVLLVDAIAEGLTDELFLARIREFSPALLLLETSTPTINVDLAHARRIKNLPGREARMCLAGPHASHFAAELLQQHDYLDYILVGEYEWTLVQLADCLGRGNSPQAVPNLAFRLPDGSVCRTERCPDPRPLDGIPRPAYEFLPMYNYNDDFAVLQFPNVQIATSRGCPYQCRFCLWPQLMYGNNRCRFRRPAAVAEEMEWLVANYGFRSVYFDDDTFNLKPDRLITLCREIRERGLDVTWAGMARADHVDEASIAAMAAAGCVALKFGVESSNQELVTRSGKGLDLASVDRAIALCRSYGIGVHLTFTFGLPGETHETVLNTIVYAMGTGVASAQFSLVTPFPGTRLFAELQACGHLTSSAWEDFDGNRKAVIRTAALSSGELEYYLGYAQQQWQQRERGRAW